MEIQLDRIGDEPLAWQDPQELAPAVLERPEVVGLGAVSWYGTIAAVHHGFHFTGWLSYQQTLTCPRCLGRSTEPMAERVDLLIQQDASQPTTGEYELEESDLGVLHVEGEVLDTQPILMEQLQLNVPMHPLCREDCAGLCPRCGADLNAGACGCGEQPADPRWAGLAELRDRLDP